jgi:DNA-binding SARP family transcriptional activator
LYLDFEAAVLAVAEHQLSKGRPDPALKVLEKLLGPDPGQETACRLAMMAYAEMADRSGIERAYQRCRQALSQELETEPSEETTTLYQKLMI